MGWDVLHAIATDELRSWAAPDDDQDLLRRRYLELLATHPDGHRREGPPRHLTASCVVVDASVERVLLTHHVKARRWLQFGGHLEVEDESLAAAALREATEESGVDDLALVGGILELDEHDLVGSFGRCATHADVRFVAVAPDRAVPAVSAESLDVAWFRIDELPNPHLARVVGRAVVRVREL